jgi:hypothetical protein
MNPGYNYKVCLICQLENLQNREVECHGRGYFAWT